MVQKFLKKIKKNSNICIYGAGQWGLYLAKAIETERKDVNIKFFTDSYARGKFYEKEIVNIVDLKQRINEIDLVIIASLSNATVMKNILKGYRINKFIEIGEINKIVELKDFEYKENQKTIAKKLKTQKDKKIFKMLCNARNTGNMAEIFKYCDTNLKIVFFEGDNHYLECINKDAIKTVLDVGGFNGYSSILFKNEFPNLEKTYCFEPLYENFKHKLHLFDQSNRSLFFEDLIKSSPEIEVVKLGLWDKKETISFLEDPENYGASQIEEVKFRERECKKVEIQTTTIDDFVKERNIQKIDFIKMDIEGAEYKALIGGEKTILASRPQLAISIYHSDEQFNTLPIYLMNLLKDYNFYIRHYCHSLSETVLYAIPKELD